MTPKAEELNCAVGRGSWALVHVRSLPSRGLIQQNGRCRHEMRKSASAARRALN